MELLRERKTLTEWEVRFYIAQLAAGIGYCHERNILHRDLKLGNIFLGNGLKVKIADFGYAKRLSKSTERRTSICGTPNYIAPEILQSQNKKQPGPGHSFEVDIWTIGIVMYTLLCGKPPFEATDGTVKTTYDNIRRNTLTFDKGPTHPHQKHTPHHPPSAAAQDLITQMLHPEPSQRITVAAILAHPFLSMKLPSQLPISALRVPPSRKGKSHQGYDGVEPRLLFVCLERTLSTSEQTADPADFTPASQPEPEPSPERHEEAAARAAGAPATRWRCCVVSGAPPPKPPALMPAAVSRSDVVGSAVADGTVHQFQPGEVVSVVEFGPETEVGGVSMPSRLRTEHGWVEMVRDRRALFVEVPSVRPQPSMDLATICMAVGRSISAIETLLDDEVEDLRAQRDEALALAADRLEQLNSRVPQPQPTSDSGSGDSSREEEPEPEPEQREEGVPEEGVPPASAGSAVIGEVQRGSVAHTPPLPLPRLVSVAAPASAPPAQLVMRESVAGVSRTRVALPNRPAPRPPTQPQSATALITEDILSQPWADARDMLLDSGVWAEPSDAYTNPELVVGKRVWIDGQVSSSSRLPAALHSQPFPHRFMRMDDTHNNALRRDLAWCVSLLPRPLAAMRTRCHSTPCRNFSQSQPKANWLTWLISTLYAHD